jgi:hypothetical protein
MAGSFGQRAVTTRRRGVGWVGDSMRWVGVKLRNGGDRLTLVCELAAFDLANLGVFVGF